MDYFNKFMNKFSKETEYHGAEAYPAAYVITDALKRAKSFSAEDVKKSLAATDMTTVFGPVKFGTTGEKINHNKLPHLSGPVDRRQTRARMA